MTERIFIDQMNREVKINYLPQRIISIVPSQTELLYDLGLGERLVGITKFCVHPKGLLKEKAKVGGTKTLYFDRIAALKPDLIIGNKEENEEGQIKELMKHYPVWMSDIVTLNDALSMMEQVGELVGEKENGKRIKEKVSDGFQNLTSKISHPTSKKVAYFIWKDPYMLAGKNTFIDELLKVCGYENAFSTSRYPEVSMEELKKADPDLIFLSTEPYPFKEKHVKEFNEICLNAKVVLVDGEYFSWYGTRLLYAPAYFGSLVH